MSDQKSMDEQEPKSIAYRKRRDAFYQAVNDALDRAKESDLGAQMRAAEAAKNALLAAREAKLVAIFAQIACLQAEADELRNNYPGIKEATQAIHAAHRDFGGVSMSIVGAVGAEFPDIVSKDGTLVREANWVSPGNLKNECQ